MTSGVTIYDDGDSVGSITQSGGTLVESGELDLTTLAVKSSGIFELESGTVDGTVTATSSATIDVEGGTINGTVTATNSATIDVEGGTINGNVSVASGSTLEMGTQGDGGTINGSATVEGSTLELTADASASGFYIEESSIFEGVIGPSQTVQIEGGPGGAGSSATMTCEDGSDNEGTILLQAKSGNTYPSILELAGGATFDNDGTITMATTVGGYSAADIEAISGSTFDNESDGSVSDDDDQSSLITGTFYNDGNLTISAGDTADVGTAGDTFTQDSGTLSAPGNFLCKAGTLLVNGGDVSGNVEADGCALWLTNSITTPTLVYATGTTTTLISSDSTDGTVQVEGNSSSNATLTLDDGANNSGTIALQSASGSESSSNLTVASGSTFVNDGSVTVSQDFYASTLAGNFDNQGNFAVSGGATLDLGTAGDTFTQDTSGTLTASGNFVCKAGTLLVNGGSVSGDVEADDCALWLADSITTPTLVHAIGTTTTLISSDSTDGTVQVGSNVNSTLTLDDGANNFGTIVLQSTSGSESSSNLAAAAGTTFMNQGTVTVNPDFYASVLTGNFTNQGTINVNTASLTLATGALLINSEEGVINASGTLTAPAGSFTNDGTLNVGNGTTAAALKISGTYAQTSTGTLDIALGGTTAGTLFDQLNVTGAAVLGGTLNVSLINDFTPANGNSFKVMTYASALGTFATYDGTSLSNGLQLLPSQATTALTLTTGTAPLADLAVSVAAQPATITLGGTVMYTVTVTDDGPNDASGVTLTDTIPSGVAIDSIEETDGSESIDGNVVTLDVDSITDGGTVILTIVVTPSSTGSFADSATVASSGTYDSNPSNNSASASGFVAPLQADLVVGVGAVPSPATLGSNVTYLVDLYNAGPDAAQGVVLTDTLPSGVSIVSVTASMGTATTSGSTITLNLATLADLATVTLAIVVTPSSVGKFTDSASATETAPGDPNPANNAGSVTATVVPPPSADLAIAVPAPSAATTATGKLSFIATVTNAGPNAAAGSTLTETFTLPVGAILASESASQGSVSVVGGVVTARFGTIADGATVTLTVVVAVSANVTLSDSATVSATTADPNLANNSASTSVSVKGLASAALAISTPSTGPTRSVTLTATVSAPPGFASATGTVVFYDASTPLGSVKVDASGRASLVVTLSNLGTHQLKAAYSGDSNYAAASSASKPLYVGDLAKLDFDGDGKADIAIFDPLTATFAIQYSGGGTKTQQLGNPNDVDIPVFGDYDGDGKTDVGLYDQTAATFLVLESGGGSIDVPLGNPHDKNVPVTGDFIGVGRTNLAIFDQTTATFYVLELGKVVSQQLGIASDVNIPVAGDYDGDGKTDFALYDQTRATFLVQESGGGSINVPLGNAHDVNVPEAGDFTGAGKTNLAIFDPTTATFYVLESGKVVSQQLGIPGDVNAPVAGDFDGDGKTDFAVYDQTVATFLILDSGGGSMVDVYGNPKHKNLPA